MQKTILQFLIALLVTSLGWAQATRTPSPAAPPATAYFSQMMISGCVLQAGGAYWLKDSGSGTVYWLQGNDALLRPAIGHIVVASGSASPAGVPAENAARNLGATEAANFSIQDIQSVADQCSATPSQPMQELAAANAELGTVSEGTSGLEPQIGYSAGPVVQELEGCVGGENDNYTLSQDVLGRSYYLQGNTGLLKDQAGHWVRLAGYMTSQDGRSGFVVQGLEPVQLYCFVPANPGGAPIPVTGKAGNEGEAMITSDTSSVGQVTPGNETQAGRARQGAEETGLASGGVPQLGNPTGVQGAPPNWEYVGETPTAAARIAAAANWSELNPSGIFGPIPFMVQTGQAAPAPPPPGAPTPAGTPGVTEPATAQGAQQPPPNQPPPPR